jgi:hypothetical protein
VSATDQAGLERSPTRPRYGAQPGPPGPTPVTENTRPASGWRSSAAASSRSRRVVMKSVVTTVPADRRPRPATPEARHRHGLVCGRVGTATGGGRDRARDRSADRSCRGRRGGRHRPCAAAHVGGCCPWRCDGAAGSRRRQATPDAMRRGSATCRNRRHDSGAEGSPLERGACATGRRTASWRGQTPLRGCHAGVTDVRWGQTPLRGCHAGVRDVRGSLCWPWRLSRKL